MLATLRSSLTTVFALLAACCTLIGTAAAQSPDRYIVPGDKAFPEGIAFQPSTGDFFVSSAAGGAIYQGNIARDGLVEFLPANTNGLSLGAGMRVDDRGRLFIAGGPSGMLVYDIASKQLIGKGSVDQGGFANDVTVTPDGNAYVTDSFRPVIYKATTSPDGSVAFAPWLDLTNSPIVYGNGFNLNGVVHSPDGKYLITVQSEPTGNLYRIDIATQSIQQIDLGGTALVNGDGLVLDGQTLYMLRIYQNLLVKLTLNDDYTRGSVMSSISDPSFTQPSSAAKVNSRLFVVNSQIDKLLAGQPPLLPFTVSIIALDRLDSLPSQLPRTAAAPTPLLLGLLALAMLLTGIVVRYRCAPR